MDGWMDGCMATSVETDTRKCQRHPKHSWLCVYSAIAGASCNRTLSSKHVVTPHRPMVSVGRHARRITPYLD